MALALALQAIPAGASLAAEPTAVSVTVDTSGETTRVVLTLSRSVALNLEPVDGTLKISATEPLVVEPTEGRLEDDLLAGWQAKDDKELVLTLGPGYRAYDSFELRNPARLVVDFRGERKERARGVPEASPAAETVIVLDPGHGGVETGAVGPTGAAEKEVALDIARRLRELLEREKGVSVVLTRDEDRIVPLDERTAIANHNRAELFVSIHLNASPAESAFGAETYFLSAEATDDKARTLAALENRAFGVEDERQVVAPDGNEDRDIELILWDLAQNQYLAESSRLAESVQRELNALAGTRNRGIRQAPFTVLMGATMPAILVEAGFVSNPAEEGRLKDGAYRQKVAEALARAIAGYRKGVRAQEGREAGGAPRGARP